MIKYLIRDKNINKDGILNAEDRIAYAKRRLFCLRKPGEEDQDTINECCHDDSFCSFIHSSSVKEKENRQVCKSAETEDFKQ
jgi:hypothetical protein